MITPDRPYDKTNLELRMYEDAEVARILSKVPNYYSASDQTIWGRILRAAASEIARLEYQYAYDMLSKDPYLLSPVDIKRQYADLLEIPREYPSVYQSDQEYHDMLVALIEAFRLGSTPECLTQVIRAYLNKGLVIEELFKKINTAGYGITDRNTIRVATHIDPNSTETRLLTENLYHALDLAKPAHVGLTLHTMFSETESLQEVTAGIKDYLKIVVWFVEDEPLETPLYPTSEGGLKFATTPETHVGPVADFYTKAPITLSGFAVQVGGTWKVDMKEGDVVKVSLQANPQENGYYFAKSGAWERYKNPALGVVSPILNRVWEVQDEAPIIYDME